MTARVDENGRAYAGSQRHIQTWVEQHPQDLNLEVRGAIPELPAGQIEWVSPRASDHYREYQDGLFLDRLGLSEHRPALSGFWPQGGPVWDALARVHPDDRRDTEAVLLIEAKSYPRELIGGGCKATPVSRERIERSLSWTQQRLGISDRTPSDWCGPLYQTANRLAHTEWLRSQSINAWLVHILFTDDPREPTTPETWALTLRDAGRTLGLNGAEHARHLALLTSPLR